MSTLYSPCATINTELPLLASNCPCKLQLGDQSVFGHCVSNAQMQRAEGITHTPQICHQCTPLSLLRLNRCNYMGISAGCYDEVCGVVLTAAHK